MIAAMILVALVIKPVVKELFLACVFAGVLWPVQQWLTKHVRGKRGIAAGILTVLVVITLLGPVALMATFIIRDGADGIAFVSEAMRSKDVANLLDHLPASARDAVTDAINQAPRDLTEATEQLDDHSGQAVSTVSKAVVATGSIVFHTVLMLIALFFLLVRGHELVAWLDNVSPLRRGQTRELLSTFRRVSYAVIASAAITAAVQAVAAWVGFLIARVPSPLFFALVTFLLAFIPAIGAAVVCLFAALLLLVTGHPYMAAFLAAWGLVVVGLVDNLVKRRDRLLLAHRRPRNIRRDRPAARPDAPRVLPRPPPHLPPRLHARRSAHSLRAWPASHRTAHAAHMKPSRQRAARWPS
jgi:predicted PurR-regulated permease PerM